MRLDEDLDTFDAFPWGTHVFRQSIFCFNHALDGRRERFKKRQQANGVDVHTVDTYNIYGLAHTLLIFAFEVIPELDTQFEARRDINLSPRILKWELSRRPRVDKLSKIFTSMLLVPDPEHHMTTETNDIEGSEPEDSGGTPVSHIQVRFETPADRTGGDSRGGVRGHPEWGNIECGETEESTENMSRTGLLKKGFMEYGCPHYRRRCRIRAPCCNKIFDCRHFHNEAMNSINVDQKLRHDIPRHQVKQMICSLCGTEQQVQQVCVNCGVCMAEYLCVTCKLFDDDVTILNRFGSFAMIAEKLQTSSTMLLLRNARIANPTTLAKQGAEQVAVMTKLAMLSMVTNTLALPNPQVRNQNLNSLMENQLKDGCPQVRQPYDNSCKCNT
ncbi:hypothetical protein Dsin_017603 [Dipteronia sinensis]|uniref:CHY-type domain-containing protein n=1 Tax=Dipteronia sinensis TaxID=43782 RepID=A0AAE0AGN1_9ROSI|nr:hypothetical protein Dsin_017603 [Dipteronia sinensis]